MADKNMEAEIKVEFEEASSRQSLNSGENTSTLWGKVKKFLTDLKAVAFSGKYSDLSGLPDLTGYAIKSELNTKAEKILYGDTTINVGRLSGSTVGERSAAEGSGTTASGNYSHSEGAGTVAKGQSSHAEGCATYANGDYSHAEGLSSQANAAYSHAGGYISTAGGETSFAHGKGTCTYLPCETAFGKYNKSSTDTVFSVGDGSSDSDRHNAFEVTTAGGKLHDKDIATADDIPTKLPANGGNADTVNNKKIYMSVYTNVAGFGVSATDTADTIWRAIPDGSIYCSPTSSFTDESWNFPSGYISQSSLLIFKINNNRLGGMYIYPKTGGHVYWANLTSGGSFAGNWSKMSDDIKSVTVTASTDASSSITLPNSSARNYIGVTANSVFAFIFIASSGDQKISITNGNFEKSPNTSVTFTAYYCEK